MRHKKTTEADNNELPHIDPTVYYDTKGAATVLGYTESQLRQWRHRDIGPKYSQPFPNSRCQYLGAWLIAFRKGTIVEPTAQAGASR